MTNARKFLLAATAILLAVGIWAWGGGAPKPATIGYGISPYQDTAMPVVARDLGLYEKNGLDVKLVSVAWEDVIPSLASAGKTVDVGIGSINLLLPRAENINLKGGGDVVFYYPFYVFKGAAILMQGNATAQPLSHFLARYPNDRDRAVSEAMAQLKGATVALPQGSPYEQMFRAAAKIAGMDPEKDFDLRYVKLADALPAFLAGDIAFVGAGVTQRTEAARHGHKVFMDMESLGFAEVIGLVTTRSYAEKHRAELDRLVEVWFNSVATLKQDVDRHSKGVLDYLAANASTKYTLEEYKAALQHQEFPTSLAESERMFFGKQARYAWDRTWDILNDYITTTGQASQPIPKTYFLGEEVRQRLVR